VSPSNRPSGQQGVTVSADWAGVVEEEGEADPFFRSQKHEKFIKPAGKFKKEMGIRCKETLGSTTTKKTLYGIEWGQAGGVLKVKESSGNEHLRSMETKPDGYQSKRGQKKTRRRGREIEESAALLHFRCAEVGWKACYSPSKLGNRVFKTGGNALRE